MNDLSDKQKLDQIVKLSHELTGYMLHSPKPAQELVKDIRRLAK